MTKPKYGLLLTPTEAMAYDEQRDAARAALAALRSGRLMLHAWRAQRENMGLVAHPELEREILAAERAIAQAQAAGIT